MKSDLNYWKSRILLGVSLTYGGFYLCRLNLSIVLPEIGRCFGYTKTTLGEIGSAFFICYALGQFINGQLGDRISPRLLILYGLVVSSLLNIAFGFSSKILAFIIFWGANGYFQSMGWGPSVKIVASWFPLKERGKASGIMGLAYKTGNVFSWLLVGYLIQKMSWRWGFFVPAIILLLIGIYFFIRVKNSPREAGLTPEKNINKSEKSIFRQGVGNPLILRIAVSNFFLSITGYGLLLWIPTHLSSISKSTISTVALQSVILPLAGALSGIFIGWLSDKHLSSKRVPPSITMLLLSIPLTLAFPHIQVTQVRLTALFFMGFLIYGPTIMMVGAMPMDYATEKAASSSAGFIDSLGYAGAAISGVGIGWILDHYSWGVAFTSWATCTFISCLIMLPMWKHLPDHDG